MFSKFASSRIWYRKIEEISSSHRKVLFSKTLQQVGKQQICCYHNNYPLGTSEKPVTIGHQLCAAAKPLAAKCKAAFPSTKQQELSTNMPDIQQAVQAFHQWRRDLLLPGHASGTDAPDPELVLSSKMLKVFSALHPEFLQYTVQLQLHFVEKDYTNRVKPEQWRQLLEKVEASS